MPFDDSDKVRKRGGDVERREAISATGLVTLAVVLGAGTLLSPRTGMAGCGVNTLPLNPTDEPTKKSVGQPIEAGFGGFESPKFVVRLFEGAGLVVLAHLIAPKLVGAAAKPLVGAAMRHPLAAAAVVAALLLIGHKKISDANKTALKEDMETIDKEMTKLIRSIPKDNTKGKLIKVDR